MTHNTTIRETPLSPLLGDGEHSVLCGVVGSTAYGLATDDSDVDRLGVHVADTDRILGLTGPTAAKTTRTSNQPDGASHELAKYCGLALACNPTILELLWLENHEHGISQISQPLLELRRSFLSAPRIRSAYGGYATQQAQRLQRRTEEGRRGFDSDLGSRTEKHARHCARLCLSGLHALETGDVLIDVSDHRDWLFEIGDLAATDVDAFVGEFNQLRDRLDATDSDLPPEPDSDAVNDFLVSARRTLDDLCR